MDISVILVVGMLMIVLVSQITNIMLFLKKSTTNVHNVSYTYATEERDTPSESYVRELEQKLADAESTFKDINEIMSTTRPLTEDQLDKVSELAVEGWNRVTEGEKIA